MLPRTPDPNCSQGTRLLEISRGPRTVEAILGFAAQSEFDSLRERAAEFLSGPELAYFRGLPFPRRQQSYLLGRFAAKLALSGPLREPDPARIEIRTGVFEQPRVVHPSGDPPEISISHCEQLAVALAFPAGHPMAIDVEAVNAKRLDTIRSQLTPDEIEWTQTARSAESPEPLLGTVAWTAREALSKVLKCGLMCPMEILALCRLRRREDGIWEGEYENFAQYRFVSVSNGRSVLSIALPRNSALGPIGHLREILT